MFLSVQKNAVSSELGNNKLKLFTKHPMTVMSDDPSVKKIENWKEVIKSNLLKTNEKETSAKDRVESKKTVVELEVTDKQASLVNKSKSFVFIDNTERSVPFKASHNNGKRFNQIENLRHLFAR